MGDDVVVEMATARLSEEEFWELYTSSQQQLTRYAARQMRNAGSAEDVVTESFIATLKALRGGSGPARENFHAYLRVVIRNEITRLAKATAAEIPTNEIESLVEQRQTHEAPDVHEDAWDEAAAKRAFAKLPQRSQEILSATEVEGVKLSELGKRLGMSESSVAAAAYRARDALRTSYLVEVVSNVGACSVVKKDHLAVHARGKSPALRRRRIEAHKADCEQCQTLLQVMLSTRMPASIIVVLAVGGRAAAKSWVALPASATAAQVLREIGAMQQGIRAKKVIAVVIAVGVLISAVLAGQQLAPDQPPVSTAPTPVAIGDETPEPSPTPSAASTPSATPPAKPEAPRFAVSAGTPERGAAPNVAPDPEPVPVVRDPAPPKPIAPEVPEIPEPEPLPPGVRSIEWQQPPAGYVAGGRDVRLLLLIEFDPNTEPSEYEVTVETPEGTTLVKASAACDVTSASAACIPEETMLGLESYRLQFFVDLSVDAPLPDARIEKIATRA